MIQYMMMPLDEQYDGGFGAIAQAFETAAIELRKANPKPAFFEHLPQSFLYRHAVELFLKSEIVILHKKLKIPYGTEPHDKAPMISVNGEWKPIHKVHSISTLYEHWKSLIAPRTDELREMCKYKPEWTIPPEADEWTKTIETTDPRSTYSRYPSLRNPIEDRTKSPLKNTAPDDLFPPDRPEETKIMALVIENKDGEFVKAYVNEKDVNPDDAYMSALERFS